MNETIPALSLREPWLWAVLYCGKTVENRVWRTDYRGRIRLHASKTWDPEGERWLRGHGFDPPSGAALQRAGRLGAYVGEVTVTDCWTLLGAYAVPERQLWADGPWCWILADPKAYPEPIPGRGYPGLFYPERFARKGTR